MKRIFRTLVIIVIVSCAAEAKPNPTINNSNHSQNNITNGHPSDGLQHVSEADVSSSQTNQNQNETLIIFKNNNSDGGQSHSHGVTIQRLHATCSALGGIFVTVEFSGPFNGVIYSDKHFSHRKCRYLEANSGKQTLTFNVALGDCGTTQDIATKTIQNTIIFQMDEIVQEKWDVAQRISCEYSTEQQPKRKHRKMVFFKSLSLGMLDAMSHNFHEEFKGLNYFMDIRRGSFPNMMPIDNDGQVETGETLTILITLKDSERQYDMSVKDCWALDSENFDDARSNKIQLMGLFDGCAVTSKIMGKWGMYTNDTAVNGNGGRWLMAHANLTAFKFPTSNRVHLTCNIEVCKGPCEVEDCKPNESDLVSFTQTASNLSPPPLSHSY